MKLTTFKDLTPRIKAYHSDKGMSRGLSTGWPILDELFTLRHGNLHVVTGIPSSGKSELIDQLMLQTIALHDWHWTVFSPENWPLEAHFQKLAEKWTGKPMFGQGHVAGITEVELDETIDFLGDYLTFLEPTEKELNIDALLKGLEESEVANTTNAFLLDPWNECEHQLAKNVSETNYISEALSKIRNFGRRHKIAMFIVAHPTKLQKKDDGDYPVPGPYDISGSANWRNKADVCLSVWRSYQANDGVVQVHIQKMRNKNLGKLGNVNLNWLWSNGIFSERKVELTEGAGYAIKHRVV